MTQVLNFMTRDYINFWYDDISKDGEFIFALRETLNRTLSTLSNWFVLFSLWPFDFANDRCKEERMDWVHLLTDTAVQVIVLLGHFHWFRLRG